jgi:hypothetical protein
VKIRRGQPFRGSIAITAGVVTPAVLRGPRFRRLLPDVHVTADTVVDLEVLSLAAAVLVGPRGVLSGYSAAEVLGASCARPGAPAEVTMLGGHQRRPRPGLVVHRDALRPDELTRLRGVSLTSPERTAYDLARRAPSVTEAVVAVDAVCHPFGLDPAVVLVPVPGARGVARFPEVLRLADPRSGSPMETRIRLAIVLAGLPAPVLQHPVPLDGHPYELDLAYPRAKLAIEHNGAEHLTSDRHRRDLLREQLLAAAGWRIVRFDAPTVLFRPDRVADRVGAELRARLPRQYLMPRVTSVRS